MEFVKLAGPFGVFFVMFSLGLNLTIEKFTKVFKNPNNLIVGLFCQIIILPVIGLIVTFLVPLESEFRFGIFLLLIMPSAAMSNYASRLANGDVSLSICLTSICALFSFITIPFYLKIFTIFINENLLSTDINLFLFSIKTFTWITLPVFLGIFCRNKFNIIFEKLTFTFDRAALILFISIVLIAIYTEKDNLIGYFNDVGVIMSLILFLIFVSSFIITQIYVDDISSRRAIRIEALLQNGAMGFVIGALIFSEIMYLVPIAIYALLQYCFLLFYLGNIQIKN